jgi:hypothetical protein
MARRSTPLPAHSGATAGRPSAALALSVLLAAGAACAPLALPPPAQEPAPAESAPALLEAGQDTVLGGCLRVRVEGFSDRAGEFSHTDWVDLRVTNGCPDVRRHLLVELVLLDPSGEPYGGELWLLQRGELLAPGRSKRERFAVPDPDDRTPVRWAIRLRQVERPRPVRPAPGVPATAGAAP